MTENKITQEESELEQEFRSLIATARTEIKAKLAEATKALNDAVALSEKYGVPFDPGIYWV